MKNHHLRNKSWKILVSESHDYSPVAVKLLQDLGEVSFLQLNYVELKKYIKTVDVLVIRLGIVLDKKILILAENLKYIVSPTTGVDHIDQVAALERGIEIISLKGEQDFLNSIPSTAEHTFGLLLSLVRKIPSANYDVAKGNWNRQAFRGNNLKGKTLGILGLGRVGHQVANFARTFGMKVIAYDPSSNYECEWIALMPSPEALFEKSEILSIHIPQNEENMKYVTEDLINLLPKKACLVNTSRGGVWDEIAVAKALENGNIYGVATDVLTDEYNEEKRIKSPLLKLLRLNYNVIITPHIAGATFESMHTTEDFIIKKLIKKLKKI